VGQSSAHLILHVATGHNVCNHAASEPSPAPLGQQPRTDGNAINLVWCDVAMCGRAHMQPFLKSVQAAYGCTAMGKH
jgi:hypothetical protein